MTSLDEVAEIKTGFAFKSAAFSTSGVRLLRGDNIGQGRLQWENAAHWEAKAPDGYALADGDIVLAMDRPRIGAGLKLARVYKTDLPALLVQRVARLRAKPGVDQRFLEMALKSPSFCDYLQSIQTGTAIPHVSSSQIKGFQLRLPILGEQRAIAAVLGALDDKIAVNASVSETARELAGLQFAVIATSNRTSKLLGDVLDLRYGKALPSAQRRTGTIAVVGSGGVVGSHSEALTPGPCVVVGRKGSVGSTYWVPGNAFPIDTTFYVEPAPSTPLIYCYYLLRSLDLAGMNSDSAVPGLNRAEALALPVLVPNPPEMRTANQTAEELFALAVHQDAENKTLLELRDTLLPALMSGRLRVKDAERQVEDAV